MPDSIRQAPRFGFGAEMPRLGTTDRCKLQDPNKTNRRETVRVGAYRRASELGDFIMWMVLFPIAVIASISALGFVPFLALHVKADENTTPYGGM
jgi:nitrate reductase NapE component